MPDTSPYGGQTVMGPGWPNVDENALAAAAMSYERLAAKLTGSVVPQQQGQMMQLSDTWEGSGAVAAVGEASTIITGHEANAAHAAAIAVKLRSMEAAVIQAKMAANAVAVETQRECEALAAAPFQNKQELMQSRIAMGLSQNVSQVTAGSTELAGTLGVPPTIPTAGVPGGGVPGEEAAEGAQQGAEMVSQMAGMAAQIPGQIAGMLGQIPQQMSQPLQQLTQPLQQMTSLFGGGSGSGAGAGGLGATPFSSFSNHPLAGGSGAGGGSGMVRAASLPGAGGSSAQTPLMANLVGKASPVAVDAGAAAGTAVAGGVAPVAAGMGGGMGGGGMGMGPGMMGQRGSSGGTRSGLAAPEMLEHDLGDGDEDDDW